MRATTAKRSGQLEDVETAGRCLGRNASTVAADGGAGIGFARLVPQLKYTGADHHHPLKSLVPISTPTMN